MSRPTVLVLGANGRVGHAAVLAFAAAGWRVLAQARRSPAAALPAGAELLATPLHDTATLATQAATAQVVVYAVSPPYTRWDAEALPLARQGMAVAEALGATFMLPGNVYNYGEQMPALLREDTPERPSTAKGSQRCALEAELRQQAAQGRLKTVVIRAGDFFGGGSGTWFDQAIVKNLAQGKLVYPGPLDVAHAWAYLPDLARAFVAVAGAVTEAMAARHERPAFETLHFAGHTCTGRELLAAIETEAHALGLQPAQGFRHGSMPWGLIRTVGLVYPLWRELARMSYLWRVPHALDGAALERAVGALQTTPLPAALRATLLTQSQAPTARPAGAAA
jgi:nucleoside-diphosphate-sugar epimerase